MIAQDFDQLDPIDLPRALPVDPSAVIDGAIAPPPISIPDPETWVETLDAYLGVFNGYSAVLVAAFFVTLCATPLMRRLAVAYGIIDRPNDPRKIHRIPIAYLGGVGVYLGIMAGIIVSYAAAAIPGLITPHDGAVLDPATNQPEAVPPSIVIGLSVIMLIGLLDDIAGITPRYKIAGQIFAAAALALDNVGVNVARGLLAPTIGELLGNRDLVYMIDVPLLSEPIGIDLIYWTGTAVIAVFVLGACNASNLIDGLDGLLSGVTGIATAGLLVIGIMIIFTEGAAGPRDAQRIVLTLAVLGACLGFLPHNFNPATIFLGDCGSLLLGFATIVIVLTLGDQGRTDFVVAGLVVYAIPIIDTLLAIVRRKMSGKRMSDADSDHLHHMLKRALGVKGAVLTLYGIGAGFAFLGVLLAMSGARVVYSMAFVFTAFLMVYSTKIARMRAIEEQARSYDAAKAAAADPDGAGQVEGSAAAKG
ncbi:MAG: MraY family glycosyltransferase [Planctomycetota bacterium]